MKIQLQFYVFNPPLGGVENYFLYVGKELQKQGHDVSILCTRLNDSMPECEVVEGMPVISHPLFLPPRYAPLRRPDVFVDRLAEFMRDETPQPDAIISRHCYYANASLKAYPGFKNMVFLPPASLLAVEDVRSQEFKFLEKKIYLRMRDRVKAVEKAALSNSPHVATLSKNMRDQFAELYKIGLSNVQVIPPGIDAGRFKPSDSLPAKNSFGDVLGPRIRLKNFSGVSFGIKKHLVVGGWWLLTKI